MLVGQNSLLAIKYKTSRVACGKLPIEKKKYTTLEVVNNKNTLLEKLSID